MKKNLIISMWAITVVVAGSFLFTSCAEKKVETNTKEISYVSNPTKVEIYSSEVQDTVRLMLISDTHLWKGDSREEPFSQYSKRMAKAYNETKHFITRKPTNPEESFVDVLEMAGQKKVDAIALLGDIFSYPSEYSIEWAKEQLDKTGIPYYYTCGNHDWHYEGMEGTSRELRKTWIEKRLKPLFGDVNPLMYSVEIKGVKILMIDDSILEILPEQVNFFRQEEKEGKPMLLMMHVPLYAPGRRVSYAIGNPNWNAANDNGYRAERRLKWPEEGHKPETYEFYNAVINSPNLMASFTGHIHEHGVDIMKGKPHFNVRENASGGYLEVVIIPNK
ncbi:MAG: metallophosphoesterase [Parabacteroides sp.]|nr:metallophosphoesterase [Parabacteroides sp.]